MYRLIDAKRTTRTLYAESLVGRGDITAEENEAISKEFQAELEAIYAAVHNVEPDSLNWQIPKTAEPLDNQTSVSVDVVNKIAETQIAVPSGFSVHQKLLPQLQKRVEMVKDGTIDWGMGETLTYGSLLLEGHPVRIAGQDAQIGRAHV